MQTMVSGFCLAGVLVCCPIAASRAQGTATGVECINAYKSSSIPTTFKFGEDVTGGSSENGKVVDSILAAVGMRQKINIYQAELLNTACASFSHDRKKVVYFGSGWLNTYSGGDYWVRVGVLAHEIGHHINDHQLGSDDAWKKEYEADYFVGRAIYLLGGTVDDALRVVRKEPLVGHSHPDREMRELAIRKGYGDSPKSVVSPPPGGAVQAAGGAIARPPGAVSATPSQMGTAAAGAAYDQCYDKCKLSTLSCKNEKKYADLSDQWYDRYLASLRTSAGDMAKKYDDMSMQNGSKCVDDCDRSCSRR